MMVINNNIPALTTYGIVNNTSNALQKSIQKLSTGLRINSAADDAAGLSISEKMRAQINGLDRAVANSQDGVSLIQTAEGALTETHSILQRMRELSVQAANDTLTQQDRSYIQEEVDLLRDEIDHIGNTTTFNTKKLLNGDAAVLWSSDSLNTKAIVNGGLREIDQFGQKKSVEGNYKIDITATPGAVEVQKTDIFTVKHQGVGGKYTLYTDKTATTGVGATDDVTNIMGENLRDDSEYTIKVAASTNTTTAAKKVDKVTNAGVLDSAVSGTLSANGAFSLALEVTDLELNSAGNAIASGTLHIYGVQTALDGTVTEINQDVDLSNAGTTAIKDSSGNATGLTIADLHSSTTLTVGDKAIFEANNGSGTAQYQIEVDNKDGKNAISHVANSSSAAANGSATVAFMNLNAKTGNITKESVTISFGDNFKSTAGTIGTVENYKIGDAAGSNVQLRDLAKFWDSQGNFMLEDPQTITITQGNGKQTKVTLYGHDTLKDVEEKLNTAIAEGLEQKQYVKDKEGVQGTTAGGSTTIKSQDHFVDFVDINDVGENGQTSTAASDLGRIDNSSALANTSESVNGTFVIRTAVAGQMGTLRFSSKSEDLINALSLNTVTEATETTYNVTITDAHTGESILPETTITGNRLVGAIHPNVDIEFDPMGGITSKWNVSTRAFEFDLTDGKATAPTTILHLADNTMVFQIGANAGDDMSINIGDMRSHALGLDSVLVTDRESASRSMAIIDNAIDRVSTQRAKLGAYQNRLEHTMTNLETSSENLSAAESRIRDTDMAKEMMNFTKLQIMLQAGNAMLAQANQQPQYVLSLIR